jgi:hypothetical protein
LSRYRCHKMSAALSSHICDKADLSRRPIVVYSSASEHLTARLAAAGSAGLLSRPLAAQAWALSVHIFSGTQWLANFFVQARHCLRLANCSATATFLQRRSMPRSIEMHYEASHARGWEVQYELATTSASRLLGCPSFARIQVG